MLKTYSDDSQFDYDNLNESHKEAAAEAAQLVEKFYGKDIADLIRQKFGVVEVTKYDLTESLFFKLAAQHGVTVNVVGWIDESGSKVIHPIISICDDIRKIHKMLNIPTE
jgi:hypothetical protein